MVNVQHILQRSALSIVYIPYGWRRISNRSVRHMGCLLTVIYECMFTLSLMGLGNHSLEGNTTFSDLLEARTMLACLLWNMIDPTLHPKQVRFAEIAAYFIPEGVEGHLHKAYVFPLCSDDWPLWGLNFDLILFKHCTHCCNSVHHL